MNKLMRVVFNIILIFSFVLFSTLGCQKKEKVLDVGKLAPDVKVLNLEDKKVKLSDFKGKVVVLRFWQEGCPACLTEMPKLDEFYKKHKKDLVVLSVFMSKDKQYLQKFQNDMQLSFPITIDQLKVSSEKYEVMVSPTSFIIDRNGILRAKVIGDVNMQDFYKKLLSYF